MIFIKDKLNFNYQVLGKDNNKEILILKDDYNGYNNFIPLLKYLEQDFKIHIIHANSYNISFEKYCKYLNRIINNLNIKTDAIIAFGINCKAIMYMTNNYSFNIKSNIFINPIIFNKRLRKCYVIKEYIKLKFNNCNTFKIKSIVKDIILEKDISKYNRNKKILKYNIKRYIRDINKRFLIIALESNTNCCIDGEILQNKLKNNCVIRKENKELNHLIDLDNYYINLISFIS